MITISQDILIRPFSTNYSRIGFSCEYRVAAFDRNRLRSILPPCSLSIQRIRYGHPGNALRKSQAYNVSPELQNAKNYYEQGLSSFQIGARKISQSLTLSNLAMMQPGLDDIDKGNEYMERAAQELKSVAG